jgi:hypothetical protein
MVNCLYVRHHATKAYKSGEVKLYIFSCLALDAAEWSAPHSSHFTLRQRATSTGCEAFMLALLKL